MKINSSAKCAIRQLHGLVVRAFACKAWYRLGWFSVGSYQRF